MKPKFLPTKPTCKHWLEVVFVLLIFSTLSWAGPFGFEPGMSKDRVINLVGRAAVEKETEDSLTLTMAPKPHPIVEKYILLFSPQNGLLKVVAVSKDIETSVYGEELKRKFTEIRDSMTDTYGQPTRNFDFLKGGSIWNEDQDWMMGLAKKERVLDTYWDFRPAHNQVVIVDIQA